MNRWLGAVGIGTLLGVLAAVAVLTVAAPEPTDAERADALARELRCPDCQALSVADSPTQSAVEIRRQIDELLAGGASADEVRAHFVARYGDWILLAPPSPLAWAIPILVVVVAAGALLAWLGRGARRDRATSGARPADQVRRRVHDEAEALDA